MVHEGGRFSLLTHDMLAAVPHLRLTALLSAMMVLMLSISAGISVLWLDDASVVAEDRLVEWSQVALLLAAAISHMAIRPADRWQGEQALRAGLALLCASLAVREVDIDRLTDWPIMPYIETGVRFALVLGWLVFVWTAWRRLGTWWQHRWEIAFSACAVLTAVGCAFYALSWPFDRFPESFGGEKARLFEEVIQLNATMLLFAAAWLHWPRSQGESPEHSQT